MEVVKLGAAVRTHFEKMFRYTWDANTAGGSMNSDTFDRNPMFRLVSSCPQRLFVKVRSSEATSTNDSAANKVPDIGVHLFESGKRVRRREDKEMPKLAGNEEYRSLITWAEYDITEGNYTFVAATFRAGHHGDFFVTVKASTELKISILPPTTPSATPNTDALTSGPLP